VSAYRACESSCDRNIKILFRCKYIYIYIIYAHHTNAYVRVNIIHTYLYNRYIYIYYYIGRLPICVQKLGRNKEFLLSIIIIILLYEQSFNRPLTESRQSGMYNRILFEYYIMIIIILLLYATDIKMRLTITRYRLRNLQQFCYRPHRNGI